MGFVIALIVCVVTATLADRKGYYYGAWFLAGGGLGLLILAFLPFVNYKTTLSDEEAEPKRKLGNTIGGVISSISGFIIVLRLIKAMAPG